MKCEKCGKEMAYLMVDTFQNDCSDAWEKRAFQECEDNAVCLDLDASWTGNDLFKDERRETIRCPHCYAYPFENTELQVHEIVRVVCFKKENEI